ncbi:hypothetical protein HF1_01510 [Mycoplasma haemofelis str. Langford 1]|uniref:Lipoprotein n=2 Tax=Mycoplasma haemofelis TaxID=29501 RepID=F6FG06_MYCHI|nr:hypothetical protein [Mycoplasma haemofelis]AEG72472.1 hypothetical protein MHF_0171 [Mycoplasma haemofelis Ohio2]CBY92159.1 hypothetical protein HF1_01510 [Mycoplasma haemofelis str. Langford 1]
MSAKLASLAALGASAGGAGAFGIYKLTNGNSNLQKLTEEEYQLVFKEFKSQTPFITALKTKTPTIESTSDNTDGGKAVKAWCVGNDSSDAKQWCIPLPKTIREKIKKALTTKWDEKIKSIKSTDTNDLLKDLQTIKSDLTQVSESDQKAKDALKGWCESKLDTRLINSDGDAIYTKVESRCLEG